jgi:hypothetical protein
MYALPSDGVLMYIPDLPDYRMTSVLVTYFKRKEFLTCPNKNHSHWVINLRNERNLISASDIILIIKM